MFGIGGFELFLILLFGFLIFGPDKLPAMAKMLGKAIAKFRSAQEEMNKVIKTEVYDPSSDEPFKNPLEALSKVGESAKKLDKDEKSETFSERKARYDKERAAKKAAEEKKAASTTAAASSAAAASAKPEKAGKSAEEGPGPASEPKPTPDELYGTKPAAKKPAAASSEKSPVAEATTSEQAASQKAATAAPEKASTAKATSGSPVAKDSKKTAVTASKKKETPAAGEKAASAAESPATPAETEGKGE